MQRLAIIVALTLVTGAMARDPAKETDAKAGDDACLEQFAAGKQLAPDRNQPSSKVQKRN